MHAGLGMTPVGRLIASTGTRRRHGAESVSVQS
jgi:hypothetical protein